ALPFGWGRWVFARASNATLQQTLAWLPFSVVMTLVFLAAARYVLVSRAFVSPKNVLLGMFLKLDRFFNNANAVTGGSVRVRGGDHFPGREPVAWRETTKKSLGTFRYLFRVLMVLELPLLCVLTSLRTYTPGGPDIDRVSYLLYALWC